MLSSKRASVMSGNVDSWVAALTNKKVVDAVCSVLMPYIQTAIQAAVHSAVDTLLAGLKSTTNEQSKKN
jgi:hypothetical protein